MSSSHPWYKRYPVDFIHGTMGLSLEEKGAYSLILDLIYDKGGAITDDARYLAGICNISLRKWASIRGRLIAAQKIQIHNGFIFNKRSEKEIEALSKLEHKLRESGAKGGRKRAQNALLNKHNKSLDEATFNHARVIDTEEEKEEEKDTSSFHHKTQEIKTSTNTSQPAQKGCRLPADFMPDYSIALSEGFTQAQAQRLFANFKDYWTAKTGKDANKRDWQATWRNWVRSPYNKNYKGNHHVTPSNTTPTPYYERVSHDMHRIASEHGFNTATSTHDGGLPNIFSSGQETNTRTERPNATLGQEH